MKWTDEGIILSLKPMGEGRRIASILTRDHGRHAGVIKISPKLGNSLQPGIIVQATWYARLPEHLGSWTLEPKSTWAAWFGDPKKLAALSSALTLTDKLLPERHLYEELYDLLWDFVSTHLTHDHWLKAYVNYEFSLLEMLGFGLDLTCCAATGKLHNLCYISPKSGRSVSKEGAEGYESKLLPLPEYWLTPMDHVPTQQLLQGLHVTGYFLAKHLAENGLPHIRHHLIDLLNH
jgi:DNA repair protein RecO (recombination protein O)